MKPKTLQQQYNLIKEGKGHKGSFLNEAKRLFPQLIPNHFKFEDSVNILKQKSIISENIWGVSTGKKDQPEWFKIFNKNMDTISEEAKAEEKEPTKEVVDQEIAGYDYKDKENINNQNGEEFLTGFYAEMQKSENKGKSVGELKDIVRKNLAKDELYYVKNGQFGLDGVGYVEDAPGLGKPVEPKGKYKASGYGDLKESIKKIIREEMKSNFPSESQLSKMKDSLENIVDMVGNADEAVSLVMDMEPMYSKYETQLRQLADPMF
tara:strand:- start:974 stop:1765 length:792 start_codon:yes stop_codon:yes gene_type:complete